MDQEIEKELVNAANSALKCSLDDSQIMSLMYLHKDYIAYRDSEEPYVSDVRFLSNEELKGYYTKLRKRAKKLLDSLEAREKDLGKAIKFRTHLSKYVFSNVIKQVNWVLYYSEREITWLERIQDPKKLADWLESGKYRTVPCNATIPSEAIARIRKKKKKIGGPTPNYLLYRYIKGMATWYEGVMGRRPGPRSVRFADLLQGCINVVEEDLTIGEKTIKNALKYHRT